MKTGRLLALYVRLVAIPLLAVSLFGFDVNSLKPQGYVSDFAHTLTPDARASVERYCARVEQVTGVQIAVVTVDTLDGEPIEDVTNTLFRKWGVGQKGKNEGLMLFLAVKDHKDRIEVGYGLEPNLPDGFVGSVLRDIRPLLQQGQYGQAILTGVESMGSRVAAAKGVTLDVPLERPRESYPAREPKIPWQLILLGLVFLVWLFSRFAGRGGRGGPGGGGGSFLAGMLLGTLMGRGGGGGWGGGGGFGGGDSGGGGGGFGGFGGGDSGGGGASGSW